MATATKPTTKADKILRTVRNVKSQGYDITLLGYMGVADEVVFDAARATRVLDRMLDYPPAQRVPYVYRQIIRDAARFYCDQAYLMDVLNRTTPLFHLRRIAYGAMRRALAEKRFPSGAEGEDLFILYFLDWATDDMDASFDMQGEALDWVDEDGLTSGH